MFWMVQEGLHSAVICEWGNISSVNVDNSEVSSMLTLPKPYNYTSDTSVK